MYQQKKYLSKACLIVVCGLMIALAGCGTKQVASDNEVPELVFTNPQDQVPSNPNLPSVYLPRDDGIELSETEREALVSEGDFDKSLAPKDMWDIILHFKSLVHGDGRYTVEKNIERGQKYMAYINKILEQKKLPKELAYLAFIESGYNPQSRSRSGALGIWQFIPSTGKEYGMDQNWWMDERKDPYQSTEAALTYLSRLYELFNDWHLAITAYNAGEGKILRALAATDAKTFFELRRRNDLITDSKDRLNGENQQYLPRFLAVCKIMRNLKKLDFSKIDLKKAPKIAKIRVNQGTDLLALCKAIGLSWDDFSQQNPSYRRYINHPGKTTIIYLPVAMEKKAKHWLKRDHKPSEGWRSYPVASGENMVQISQRTGVPVEELRRVNQVSEPLTAGQTLRIPGSVGSPTYYLAQSSQSEKSKVEKTSTQTLGFKMHQVVKGESLYSIANANKVDVADLKKANNLKNNHLSYGQKIKIPVASVKGVAASKTGKNIATKKTDVKKVAEKKVAKQGKIVHYKVQSGESLWIIARKFKVSPTDLLELNKLNKNTKLHPGDTVRVAVK